MDRLGDIQAVERFHLLFLTQLGARIDKKLYSLKGGSNLRFFWKSIRYSEDLDFDVHTIARETLRKNVNRIFEDPGFRRILRSHQLDILQFSQPKQTDTTQRWKVQLGAEGSSVQLPTKIEFSRRNFRRGVRFEPVDPEIVAAYGLRPILVSHYDLETAFAQKVEALIGRTETQARDVFDLAFLSERGAKGTGSKKSKKEIVAACDNAVSVSFDQFTSQVVAYLSAEFRDYYGTTQTWEELQQKVLTALQAL
ncbi:MAG TPA: nucleotidyl transferase AbiEii/AbiGii toxin family protein [Chthoniobacterales bacterium]|nr:nucleotidyl transferase AbiEii/AbiGii toxin family protein [Chthoniobacterales bacterium]